MFNKPVRIGFAAAVVLVASYVGYWFYGSSLVRGGLDRWIAGARAEGVEASYRAVDIDGFPLRFRIMVDGPALTAARGGAVWDWRSETAHAVVAPFDFHSADIRLNGEQVLTFVENAGLPLTLRSSEPTALFVEVAGDGQPGHLTLAATGVEATSPETVAGLRLARLDVAAERDARVTAAADGTWMTVTVDAKEASLPAAAAGPLGQLVERLTAELEVIGAVPQTTPRAAVQAWRDGGGRVEVKSLFVRWGPVDLALNGQLSLDEALQPAGSFTAKLTGYRELLGALTAEGQISQRDAANVRAILDLLARQPKDGGRPVLTAPLDVHQSRLMVGPVALMALPPIRWAE